LVGFFVFYINLVNIKKFTRLLKKNEKFIKRNARSKKMCLMNQLLDQSIYGSLIFSFLSLEELLLCEGICKKWNLLIKQSETIYKQIYNQLFPIYKRSVLSIHNKDNCKSYLQSLVCTNVSHYDQLVPVLPQGIKNYKQALISKQFLNINNTTIKTQITNCMAGCQKKIPILYNIQRELEQVVEQHKTHKSLVGRLTYYKKCLFLPKTGQSKIDKLFYFFKIKQKHRHGYCSKSGRILSELDPEEFKQYKKEEILVLKQNIRNLLDQL